MIQTQIGDQNWVFFLYHPCVKGLLILCLSCLIFVSHKKANQPKHDIIFIFKGKERTENLRSAYLAKLHYNLFNFVISFFGFEGLKRQCLEFGEGKKIGLSLIMFKFTSGHASMVVPTSRSMKSCLIIFLPDHTVREETYTYLFSITSLIQCYVFFLSSCLFALIRLVFKCIVLEAIRAKLTIYHSINIFLNFRGRFPQTIIIHWRILPNLVITLLFFLFCPFDFYPFTGTGAKTVLLTFAKFC